ncbi:MAG: hypothetical protein J7493_10780 [Porphyrobacter sp.]|nr:hypothetical protein [Porphyrobacter sp.]
MDGADRIPIDIGYEVASAADQLAAQGTTTLDDGALVIDILVPPPCPVEPTTDEEIVVCAAAPEGEAAEEAANPAPESFAERLGKALHAVIGPVELGSIPKRDGTRAFGMRVRF